MRTLVPIMAAAFVAIAAPASALYAPDTQPPPMEVALVLAVVGCDDGTCIEVRAGNLSDIRPGVRVRLTLANEGADDARFLVATAGHMDDAVRDDGTAERRRMPLIDVAVPAGASADAEAEVPGDADAVTLSAQTADGGDEILLELPIYTILAFGPDGQSDEELADDTGIVEDASGDAEEGRGIPGAPLGLALLSLGALAAAFGRRP